MFYKIQLRVIKLMLRHRFMSTHYLHGFIKQCNLNPDFIYV